MALTIFLTDNWTQWLEKIPAVSRDIYFTQQYVKLYETEQDTALCVVVEDENYCLLMPFLRREIEGGYFDFETPYGYGGLISNSDDKTKNDEAIELAMTYFADNGYVAGFVRFHPLLANAEICCGHFPVIDDRRTIAMDLRPSIDDIWMKQVHSKNRNTIKKAEKRELEFVTDHDFAYFADFVKLYNATMDKLSADEFYYFDHHYYEQWLSTLKEKSFLAVVKYEDRVISACIIMYDHLYGHYHLSGSDRDYLNLDPNNFMLWNAALELKRIGIQQFHLGGGIDNNPENSLYKFKSRMSPNNYQFSFGKLVFNDEIYRKLCKQWEAVNSDRVEIYAHHLLKYRY